MKSLMSNFHTYQFLMAWLNVGPILYFTAEKVTKAISGVKNLKASVPDNLPADIWKLKELHNTAVTG